MEEVYIKHEKFVYIRIKITVFLFLQNIQKLYKYLN